MRKISIGKFFININLRLFSSTIIKRNNNHLQPINSSEEVDQQLQESVCRKFNFDERKKNESIYFYHRLKTYKKLLKF